MFKIRVFNVERHERQLHDFFILSRGLNSGCPGHKPWRNSFAIWTDCEENRQRLYWTVYALFRSRSFEPLLCGSVIPFVRIREVEKLIREGLRKSNDAVLFKNLETLLRLEKLEANHRHQMDKMKDLKTVLARQIFVNP